MAFGMNNWPKSALLLELATIGLDRSILNCMRFSYFAKSVLWVNLNNIILVYIFSPLRVRWMMIDSNSVSSNNLITWYWEMKWIWQLNGIKLNAPHSLWIMNYLFPNSTNKLSSSSHTFPLFLFMAGVIVDMYRRRLMRGNCSGKITRISLFVDTEKSICWQYLPRWSQCQCVWLWDMIRVQICWLIGCSPLDVPCIQLNTTRPFCTSALELTRGRDVDDDRLRVITYSTAAVAAPPRIWLWTFHLGAVVRYGSQSYRISCWDSTSDV